MDERVIFYIAVAAAWGLYNLFVKGKKAQQKPQPMQTAQPVAPKPKTEDEIQRMLEELLNPNKKKMEAPAPSPVEAEVQRPEIFNDTETDIKPADEYVFNSEKYYDEIKSKQNEEAAKNNISLEDQMLSEIGQSGPTDTPVVEERTESVDVNEWLKADETDMRKAIIWSEILKRPVWSN